MFLHILLLYDTQVPEIQKSQFKGMLFFTTATSVFQVGATLIMFLRRMRGGARDTLASRSKGVLARRHDK